MALDRSKETLTKFLQVESQNEGSIFGASLSEPHTSVTALHTCVCIYLSIYACLDRPLTENLNKRVQSLIL